MWIPKEDENAKYFHHFVNHRKNVNTTWKMLRYYGVEVRVFVDLGFLELKHIHREDNKVSIIEVVKMISYLLGFWSTRKLESFRITIKI